MRQGKLSDTLDTGTNKVQPYLFGYQKTCETCKRTCGKETKAYPTIRNQIIMLTGDTLNENAKRLLFTEHEYFAWVRSSRSSQVR